jgi:hypothetical protein
MTPEQFCYWLNGFGELTPERPTAEQWKSIKEHLDTVFQKVTPKAPGNQFGDLNDLIRRNQTFITPAYQPNWGRNLVTTTPHLEQFRATC